eukprot:ctg_949.g220
MKADADDRGRRNDGDTADADEEVGWAANASRRKAAAFALLMDDAADDAEEPEVEHPLPKSDSAVNGKAEQKKKKKKKGAPELPPLDELELSVGDGKAESQHAASDNATKPPAAPASADLYATARPLKPSRQAEEDAEIEAILAEIDAEPQTSRKKSRKQKKKQKQAAASAAEGDEEAAVDESSAAVPAAPATEEETLPPAAEADAAPSPEGPEALTASEGSLTAAQKKRLKRKQKEAAKKAEGATAPSKDTGAGSAARAALVKRLQAQQQQRQEEELRRQRAEEEQRQREEEERRRAEEEQRRREEEREQRKEARRARREQLRREGKLLNRTERQRRARDELFRQQALAEGAVSAASMNGQAPKPQRVVSEEKRRPQRGEIMEAVEKSAVSVAGEAPDAPPSWEADAALLETTKPDEAPARARPPDQSTTSGSDDGEEQGMQGSSDDDDEEEVGSVARPTLSASSAAALAGAGAAGGAQSGRRPGVPRSVAADHRHARPRIVYQLAVARLIAVRHRHPGDRYHARAGTADTRIDRAAAHAQDALHRGAEQDRSPLRLAGVPDGAGTRRPGGKPGGGRRVRAAPHGDQGGAGGGRFQRRTVLGEPRYAPQLVAGAHIGHHRRGRARPSDAAGAAAAEAAHRAADVRGLSSVHRAGGESGRGPRHHRGRDPDRRLAARRRHHRFVRYGRPAGEHRARAADAAPDEGAARQGTVSAPQTVGGGARHQDQRRGSGKDHRRHAGAGGTQRGRDRLPQGGGDGRLEQGARADRQERRWGVRAGEHAGLAGGAAGVSAQGRQDPGQRHQHRPGAQTRRDARLGDAGAQTRVRGDPGVRRESGTRGARGGRRARRADIHRRHHLPPVRPLQGLHGGGARAASARGGDRRHLPGVRVDRAEFRV